MVVRKGGGEEGWGCGRVVVREGGGEEGWW